ncbi:MAG: hypothetical protein V1902_01945 [Candidatus Falkowbacteria bacterium]
MSRDELLAEVRGVIAQNARMPVERIPVGLRLTRGAANGVAVVLSSRGFKVDLPVGDGYIPLERFVAGVSAAQQVVAQ